jgi:hypothetical protein
LRRLPLLNLFHDHLLQTLGLRRRRPPPLDLAIPSNQELFKIPLHPLQAHHPRLLLFHPLPHLLGIVTVDIRFAQHLKTHTVIDLAEVLDLFVGPWVLVVELIAGEGEEGEVVGVFGAEVFVEGFERGELRGEATFGGRVHDKEDFGAVLGERVGLAFFCGEKSVSRPFKSRRG